MIIKVKVKPNAEEDRMIQIDEHNYEISVKAKPQDNDANIAVIKMISKHFNITHKKIKIKNPTSRNKIIEID